MSQKYRSLWRSQFTSWPKYDRFAADAESMIMLFRDRAEPNLVSLRKSFSAVER
jgi:hypothetical protein